MDIVSIGRESDNDVVFSEHEVSRHHCELYSSNGRVYIKDLGSTNGTQVNGKSISSPVALKMSDVVVLGKKVRIDWYNQWSKFYSYTVISESVPETIRYDGDQQRTVRHDVSSDNQRAQSFGNRPLVDIPASIHVKQQQEHAEVLKSGDDFKVPFKRNLGNNIGHHVGNTLGCIISIIIVAAILAIVGLLMS